METLMTVAQKGFEAVSVLIQTHPQIATVVTIGSVMSAMWTNHKNRQATIFGHSLQAITHLDQRWEALEMRNDRRLAAQYLLSAMGERGGDSSRPPTHDCEHLDAVLNFLETVGWFVQSGAIHRRTAFQLFSSKAFLYKEGAQEFIDKNKRERAALFSELLKFYAICRVEDDRVDSIGWFFWERVSSLKLTWKSSNIWGKSWVKLFTNFARFFWHSAYALARGTVHLKLELAPCLPGARLEAQLKDEASLRTPRSQSGPLS